MKGNARSYRAKEKKLLRLYSEWHATNRDDLRRKCLTVLGHILMVDPQYKIRQPFQQAF